jgi:murein DD-endopeptidase MepM/ murein hydrolase activator NlpD
VHFAAISFRSVLQFLILLTVLLGVTGKSTHAQNYFRVESLPGVAKQGEVCPIIASGPASLQSAYVEFQGVRVPMAFGEQKGTYEGLIGIDMNTQPAPYPIKIVATDGGKSVYLTPRSLKVEKVDFGVQKLSLPSSMVDLDAKTLERVNREATRLKALFQTFWDERLWRETFIRPVEGEISGAFGLSRIINGKRREKHTGVDLRAEEGTSVLACNNGMVVLVDHLFFSGKSVILDHGWGLHSMYFHLSETLVKEGDRVNKGALLGRVGSTGRSTGPHLHWGIRMNGARVDPFSLPGVIKTAESGSDIGPRKRGASIGN